MNTDGTGAKRLTKNEVATSKLHWRRLMGEGKCQVRLTQECGLAPSNLT